jgi:hypothetical protein
MPLISRDEAKEAIRRCAFTIPADLEGAGREIVHCFLGGIGADWDAADAEVAVDNCVETEGAPQVGWADTLFGECLVVLVPRDEGHYRQLTFDTVTP